MHRGSAGCRLSPGIPPCSAAHRVRSHSIPPSLPSRLCCPGAIRDTGRCMSRGPHAAPAAVTALLPPTWSRALALPTPLWQLTRRTDGTGRAQQLLLGAGMCLNEVINQLQAGWGTGIRRYKATKIHFITIPKNSVGGTHFQQQRSADPRCAFAPSSAQYSPSRAPQTPRCPQPTPHHPSLQALTCTTAAKPSTARGNPVRWVPLLPTAARGFQPPPLSRTDGANRGGGSTSRRARNAALRARGRRKDGDPPPPRVG